MPTKLVVVVVLFVVAILLNVLGGALVTAGLQGALLAGVLVGNDGVRSFLRGLAAFNILVLGVMVAPELQEGTDAIVLATLVVGVGINAYFIWALGQGDVREWMFRKNFKLDSDDDTTQL